MIDLSTRLRHLAQRARRFTARLLRGSYGARLEQELAIFADQVDVNALPDIFHYWSNKYLRPMQEEYGYSNPDQFFAHYLGRAISADARPQRVIYSLGAGNCDTEVRVAKLLREAGHSRFRLICLDANPAMLERGRQLAAGEGLADCVIPTRADLNRWQPDTPATAVMANQSLHHFVELETIFDAVQRALPPGAPFVISDMIGRNGHQRWPEALVHVQRFWQELPAAYRYNLQLRRQENTFKDWDCSVAGFEGIRAQDILPLLRERFHFHTFIGFANLVDPFIDRSFGHHFDAQADWDRDFIDRVHALDESLLLAGEITPTHMMAVVANQPCAGPPQFSRGLDPARCVRVAPG
ncbi:MAG: class I SAM-dependent methyltransferase [Lysobacteraceae bacterium]